MKAWRGQHPAQEVRVALPRASSEQVTLHRYAADPGPGDLTPDDLGDIWNLLQAEDLVRIFFHDGRVRDFFAFLAYARDPETWFYAARHNGEYIGLGVVNGFSGSGNTGFAHLVSFAAGRSPDSLSSPFAQAGRLWFELLHGGGGIDTLIAVLPGCYGGARRWAEAFGFTKRMRLPGALRICRKSGVRVTDAVVYQLSLKK